MANRDWPNPDDDALTRRSLIAQGYRAELLQVAPERCLALDVAARELGEHWIAPLPDSTEPGDFVPTKYAAQFFGVDEATIRSWGSREWVPVTRYPGGWLMSELLAYKKPQTRRRGHR